MTPEAGKPRHRLLKWWTWLVGGVLLFIILAIGSVAWVIHDSNPEDCGSYEFDSDTWTSSDAADEAASLDRCNTLRGKTRGEVIALLGNEALVKGSSSPKKTLAFRAGEVNNGSGPSRQSLYVRFDSDETVIGTSLAYPVDD